VQQVNVAVYLGEASGGLCAIDFDRDEDLAAFLAVNPKLEGTTQSRGSRGGMLWVRVVRKAESGKRKTEDRGSEVREQSSEISNGRSTYVTSGFFVPFTRNEKDVLAEKRLKTIQNANALVVLMFGCNDLTRLGFHIRAQAMLVRQYL
jgi:hypothetical protein